MVVAMRQNPHHPELTVIHEHPEWQKPLFAALERRGIPFDAYDLKRNAFDPACLPPTRLYFNQASPSAYVRGNTRAVPLALSLMRSLEIGGARVLNGSRAFALELSKSAQVALMQQLGIDHPRSIAFNDPEAASYKSSAVAEARWRDSASELEAVSSSKPRAVASL
jgi:hypothetical protein